MSYRVPGSGRCAWKLKARDARGQVNSLDTARRTRPLFHALFRRPGGATARPSPPHRPPGGGEERGRRSVLSWGTSPPCLR